MPLVWKWKKAIAMLVFVSFYSRCWIWFWSINVFSWWNKAIVWIHGNTCCLGDNISECKVTGCHLEPIPQNNTRSMQNIKELPGPLQRAPVDSATEESRGEFRMLNFFLKTSLCMSLPQALIIKQCFSFSSAAVFGGYWRGRWRFSKHPSKANLRLGSRSSQPWWNFMHTHNTKPVPARCKVVFLRADRYQKETSKETSERMSLNEGRSETMHKAKRTQSM